MVREIPGFQFDVHTGRYYAISRTGQAAGSTQQRFSHSAVEQQKREKTQVKRRPIRPVKKKCLARELYHETTQAYLSRERGILRRLLIVRHATSRITDRDLEGINIRFLSVNHDDKWLLLAHDRGVSIMSFANGLEEMPHAYFAQVRQTVFYVEEMRRFTLIGCGFEGGRDIAINMWRDDDLFCSLKLGAVPSLVRPVGANLVFVAQGRSVTFVDTFDTLWILANGKRASTDVWRFESDVISLATSSERVAIGLRNGSIYTFTVSTRDRAFGDVERISTFDSPVTNLALVTKVHIVVTYMNGQMKLYQIITQPLGETTAFTLVEEYNGYTNHTKTRHAFAVSSDYSNDGFVAVACDDAVVRIWTIWSGELIAEFECDCKFLHWTHAGLFAANETHIRFLPLTSRSVGKREWPPDRCSRKWKRWTKPMVPFDFVL